MTLRMPVLAAALLAVMATAACSSKERSSNDSSSQAATPVRALREATVNLSALSSCLDGARENVELTPDPVSADKGVLASMALGAGQRLAQCQQSELPHFSSSVSVLRTTVPWEVAHAASLAQADAQQAAFYLQQFIWGVQQVAGVPIDSRLPAGTLGKLAVNDREFEVNLERLGRRAHQLGLALAQVQAGS